MKRSIKIIFSISLISYLLYRSDLEMVFYNLRSIPLLVFIVLILFSFFILLINTLKWNLLLRGYSLFTLYKSNLISKFYSTLLIGQIAGETIKTVILGKDKKNMVGIAVSVVIDRITGFAGLLMLILFGLFQTKLIHPTTLLAISFLVLGVIVFCLFCLRINYLFTLINKFIGWIHKIFPKYLRGIQSAEKVVTTWRIYSKQTTTMLFSIALGILYQALIATVSFVVGNILDINISLIDWFWIRGIMSMAIILPLSIGGIGIREASYVGVLGYLGYASEKALAISFVVFGIQLVISLIGGIFIFNTLGSKSEKIK